MITRDVDVAIGMVKVKHRIHLISYDIGYPITKEY